LGAGQARDDEVLEAEKREGAFHGVDHVLRGLQIIQPLDELEGL
jgi:hypothetical protein